MGEGTTRVKELEEEVADLRDELSGLVAELDHRRHDALDVGLQVRRHAVGVGATIVGLLGAAAGVVWLGTWRARRRDRLTAKTSRLRQAVSRMIDQPERVAAEPTALSKILTAAANAVIATALKKILERALHHLIDAPPADQHRESWRSSKRQSFAHGVPGQSSLPSNAADARAG